MKKQLNTHAIVNELKGNSSFFKEVADKEQVLFQQERTEKRSENRTPLLPTKRLTRRYSFEFYDDQIQQVKRLQYEALLTGRSLSMSELVRHALDRYLQETE